MAKSKTPAAAGRGHAPVSNQPAATTVRPTRPLVHPPSPGTAGGRAPTRGAVESIARSRPDVVAAGPVARVRWVPPTDRLRDVAAASFGPPPPSIASVVGSDDRVRVTDTALYPFRAVAALLIVAADNSAWFGTAWFISPRTLVTAGHCVFINSPQVPARHGWVRSISVMPGRDADKLPFGAATATDFHTSEGWAVNADPNFDYGAIVIPAPLGEQTGTFGFGVYPDDDLAGTDANIVGYPADKDVGTNWYDHKTVVSVGPTKIFYDIDTAGGQSGAPVYRIVDGQTVAVAVHAYGTGGGIQSNSGTRITRDIYDNLVAWKQ